MLSHLEFRFRPFPMEAKHGNAPVIDHLRINVTVAIVVRNHLAPTGKSKLGAVVSAQVLL